MAGSSGGEEIIPDPPSPIKLVKFNFICGDEDLRLSPVPITLEDRAIVINIAEEEDFVRHWECCLSDNTIRLNPHLPSNSEFLAWKWDLVGSLKLIGRVKCIFLLRVSEKEDRDRVLKMGNHSVSGHLLLLKEWNPNDPIHDVASDEILVWIQIRYFSTRLWDDKIFAKIASIIGSLILVDKMTKDVERLNYARMCILMKPSSEFPKALKHKLVRGETIDVKVKYEWKPHVFSLCKLFGHESEFCNLKTKDIGNRPSPLNAINQVWVPINKNPLEHISLSTKPSVPVESVVNDACL